MKRFLSPLFCNSRSKSLFTYTALIMLSILMMQSCIKKDDFDFDKIAAVNYDPNVAAPLIHSKLTLRDILNDYDTNHLFSDYGTGFLYLIYNSTVFSKRADQFITISDQSLNTPHTFAPGPIAFGDSVSTNYNTPITFTTTHGERYDSIRIKSGSVNFSINSDINHRSRIDITIPGATKNGVTFKKSIPYNYSGGPVNINQAFDLSGYTIAFAYKNQIEIDYKITSFYDGNPDLPSYFINTGESFQNIAYKIIYGYLGVQNFTINQDSVLVELFKNNIYGSLHFEDPRLHIYANNAFGMPLKLTFNALEAHSNIHPSVQISGIGFTNPWTIEAPAQPGQTKQTVMNLDKTTSNFDEALDISPEWVTCRIDASSNPSGDSVNDHNFVMDTSRFSVDVEVELPLYGYAKDFRLQDTLDFDVLGDDIDKAEWIRFKINTDNGFPIDAKIQVYFVNSDSLDLNSHYYAIDSMLVAPSEQIVAAAPVGSDFRVIAPNHKYVETTIYKNRIIALKKADKILVYSKLATVNNGASNVKIYSDYFIDIKIGAQVQGHSLENLHK